MIEIKDLTKSFDGVEVLSHISMTLESGKIYGLVGRNGSGKTMLMKHILGFVSPTSGTITIDGKVLGKDIDAPDNIGAIIENPGFLPGYSGFRNLKMLASIRHKISDEDIKNAIRLVGLDPESKKHVGKYSLGMRQRLGLAQALMEHPDILLLDEPLSGLDNDGVQEMELVSVLRRGYIAVTVSSGTAAAGGQVYLTSTGAISADPTSNTALSGATFMGPADANGLAEIAFNI